MAKQIGRNEISQNDLLVFGYSCKIFRDNEKAIYIEKENHLIPWMGNSALMIDRYDVRGALFDVEAAAAIDYTTTAMSLVEQKEEELCERERYLALYHDLDAHAEAEDEEKKRLQVDLESGSSDYNQVGFTYNLASAFDYPATSAVQQPVVQPQAHPQGYTPQEDDDTFIPPPTLIIPPGLTVPTSIKQHKIIVKTAKFIAAQGSQMEIVLKAKQANNIMFRFLSFDNILNQYYKHLVKLIKAGKYTEEPEKPPPEAKQASFNPPDAAPGVKTPKVSKPAPPPDCSYSKLISKIRENQAKSGTLPFAADSRSQSPLVDLPTPTTTTTTTAAAAVPTVTTAAVATAAVVAVTTTTGVGASTDVPAVTVTCATTATTPSITTAAQAPTVAATPTSLPTTATSTPVVSTAVSKAFTGLVDYPSFNCTNDNDDYSNTDTDSDDKDKVSPLRNGTLVNGKAKHVVKVAPIDGVSKKLRSSKPKELASVVAKSNSYDNIRWPDRNAQMAVDKIACYVVRNGAKFENVIKSRGDPRFQFLDGSHEHHAYYQLKLALYTEVFGGGAAVQDGSPAKHVQNGSSEPKDGGNKGSSSSSSKSWSVCGSKTASSNSNNAAHTISFSIKQRRDHDVALPASSFPLESSSSEDDTEDMDEEEKERRVQEREERRSWRKRKREQFEQEKKDRKIKDDKERLKREKMEEKERKLKAEKDKQRLKELEEQENASGDEEMYDIFKYAQESGSGPTSRQLSPSASPDDASQDPAPRTKAGGASRDATPRPRRPKADQKLKRKKAAHAFLSKLKRAPGVNHQIIGPQLPPELAAQMMDISPPCSPSPSTTPPPLPPVTPPPPPQAAPAAEAVPEVTPVPLPSDLDPALLLSSVLPPAGQSTTRKRGPLLAAAVTSLLANEDCAIEKSSLEGKRRDDSKPRRHKLKRRRNTPSVSPERSSRPHSSKKKKQQRSHHHKKHRHHSPHKHADSHHRKYHHASHKKKSKSSSKKDKSKKKKSRRRRSTSVSSMSSGSSSSLSSDRSRSVSRSQSRSSSSDSYKSLEPKRKRTRSDDERSDSDNDVQVISDSSSNSRASSIVSVHRVIPAKPAMPSVAVTPASSRASSASRAGSEIKAALPDGVASILAASPLPLTSTTYKVPLCTNFDMKSSSAMAKITQGLRAKVHALMDKKRPDD